MKLLVTLNIILAFLQMVVDIAFQKYESGGLLMAGMVLMLLLGGLALWNIISVFTLWSRYRFRAFYPIITLAAALAICFQGTHHATRILLAGTPCDPGSFLQGQPKKDLERAATQLLGQSFKSICADCGVPVQMIAGSPQKAVPPDVIDALRRYGFQGVEIDDAQDLVSFSYLHMRTWFRYTYTTNKVAPLDSRPPTITKVNIVDWSELIRIAKQGDHATAEEERRIAFTPGIIYPYLQQNLGQDLLTRLRDYSSDQDISTQQKQLVLTVLNHQWLPSSRLVENPGINYDSANNELHIGRIRMGRGFWVVALMEKLLSEGVLTYADDKSHLRIRDNLSSSDQNKIAWLHVGLMNDLYGNLFKKTEHLNDRYLGDGWSFTVE